jgi:hypothetical protein
MHQNILYISHPSVASVPHLLSAGTRERESAKGDLDQAVNACPPEAAEVIGRERSRTSRVNEDGMDAFSELASLRGFSAAGASFRMIARAEVPLLSPFQVPGGKSRARRGNIKKAGGLRPINRPEKLYYARVIIFPEKLPWERRQFFRFSGPELPTGVFERSSRF